MRRWAAVPGRPRHRQGHRAERQRVHAAHRLRVGSDRHRHVVGARELRHLLRPVPERRRARPSRSRSAPCRGRSSTSSAAPGLNFQNPYPGPAYPQPEPSCGRPRVFALDVTRSRRTRRPGTSACSASLFDATFVEVRYVGRQGHAPAAQRRGEPRGLRPGRHGAERRPPAPLRELPRRRRHVRLLDHRDAEQHHRARPTTRDRPACPAASSTAFGFNVSYWYSKSIDYLSAMNLSGAAAKPLAGENDLAQNPFDLDAEHGPVAVRRAAPLRRQRQLGAACRTSAPAAVRAILDGWQVNAIAALQLRDAVHGVGLRRTSRCRPTARRSRASPPAGPNLVGDPERRTAHGRGVDQPLRVPAAEPA